MVKFECSLEEFKDLFQAKTADVADLTRQIGTLDARLDAANNRKWDLEGEIAELKAEIVRLKQAPPINNSQQFAKELIEHVLSGNKISAIKVVRQMTGLGLKEAKDLVEATGMTFKAA